MIINESLRLYPPVSLLPRMAFEDIRLGDLHIPKGLSIWIPVLAIHHSEELWGKDANEFKPDRFAGKSFAPGRHFIPFAAGPRNCIGQSFALMEAKIILSMMLSRFSFTISESYRHAPVSVLTLRPKHGVQICLKPLKPWLKFTQPFFSLRVCNRYCGLILFEFGSFYFIFLDHVPQGKLENELYSLMKIKSPNILLV